MNPILFEHYKRELQHIREMGGEFASEYPKIAGRLGLETLECSDPYVERLLEGFAFLSARVQLKIESSYSQLARHLLEMVYPDYLCPTPSMVVTEFEPSLSEGSLATGFKVEKGTRLRSQVAPDEQTECDFRTSHDLTLWPITIEKVNYVPTKTALNTMGVASQSKTRSGLVVTLKAVGGYKFSELPMDVLSLYLCGADNSGPRLYEQLFRHTGAVSVVCDNKEILSPRQPIKLRRQGYEDDEALLPVSSRTFQGYRLIQEYFSFPQRFLFAKLTGLASRLARCESDTVDIVFQFDNADDSLDEFVDAANVKLHCVPAINLFPKSADRIHIDPGKQEYHVVPDRTRPLDYELFSITAVQGHSNNQTESQEFYPYYSVNEARRTATRFYSTQREPRILSSKQKRKGTRASYTGSEMFISLVDADEAPYRSDLRQISLKTLCTNRDLPIQMPVGRGRTDFSLDIGAPVDSIRCVAGPTIPKASRAHFRDAWRLVSNLNLNYLSIADAESDDGANAAAMLRQMLELYADQHNTSDLRQIEGIVSVDSKPVTRQRHVKGHVEIARGLEVTLRFDESAFEGTGAYLLGSVFERFFTRYVGINSFTETVLESMQRNEIERWPVRLGKRELV